MHVIRLQIQFRRVKHNLEGRVVSCQALSYAFGQVQFPLETLLSNRGGDDHHPALTEERNESRVDSHALCHELPAVPLSSKVSRLIIRRFPEAEEIER